MRRPATTGYPFGLAGAGFTAVLLWILLLDGVVLAQTDWPQFLGPDRDGVYHGTIADKWPDAGPAALWRRDVGEGFSGPIVRDGKLILFHRVADNERVECMEAATGKTVWKAEYPTKFRDVFGFDNGPRATPTIDHGTVYTFGAEGKLGAWEMATGAKKWLVDVAGKFAADKGFFGMACSPLVEGDAVIVNVGAPDGGIVAFNRNTGDVMWKATGDEAGYASPTAATIHGKRYVLDLTRAGLVALDPIKGTVFFHFPFRSRTRESVNAATPLVIGDQIFISASYETGAALLRFDEKGPQKLWSGDDILSNHYATSVFANGFLYGFDGRQEMGPNLRCVELKTGTVRWSEDHFGAGTILIAGGKLLVLTEKGELICAPASPDGFKPAARAQILPFDVRAYPALADGCLFARSKDKLACVKLKP